MLTDVNERERNSLIWQFLIHLFVWTPPSFTSCSLSLSSCSFSFSSFSFSLCSCSLSFSSLRRRTLRESWGRGRKHQTSAGIDFFLGLNLRTHITLIVKCSVCVYLCAASSLSLRCCSDRISLSSCLAAFCSSTQSSIRSLLDANVSSFPVRACRIFSFSPEHKRKQMINNWWIMHQ